MVDINNLSGIYNFPNGIIGFEEIKEYKISEIASIGGDVIGLVSKDYIFICIDPLMVKPDYKIEIDIDAKKILGNIDEKDLAIICIVSICEEVTVNLSGPIVLDTRNKTGIQYVTKQNWDSIRYGFDISKIKGIQELIDFKTKRET